MSKIPSKPKATPKPTGHPQPQQAQLKAIERLMADRDYTRAVERARSLVQRFPDHGGARRLLVHALAKGAGQAAATLAAYQWAERRPNSLAALETLCGLAIDCQYLLLADRTAARVRALGGQTRGFPLPAEAVDELLQQPDGSRATRDELERFDIGKLHLEAHDFAGAERALEGVAIAAARNNRALALFHLGRSEEALTAFLDAWQQDPGNLFALGGALRLRLYRGDETGAQGLAIPLAQAPARRAEDAFGQISALLLIQENQAAWDAFERCATADWVGDETGFLAAERLQLGGCAASRLGRGDRAKRLWTRSRRIHPRPQAIEQNLRALERDGTPPAYPQWLDQGQALPIGWIDALRKGGATGLESRLDTLTASDAYLEALYLAGDAPVRELASILLQRRLKVPAQCEAAPEARRAPAILRGLAALPIGTPQDRLGFLNALRAAGVIEADEAMPFWNGKELSQVKTISAEIDREPEPSDLPEDLQSVLEESIAIFREGRYEESAGRLDLILKRVPGHRIALGNLAAIRASQGRPQEAREILRQTIAANPDYLIARCNLAVLCIEDGELDQAHQLLDGLIQRPRLHIQEVFSLFGALAMLNRARGQNREADALIANLEQLAEDEDDERLLAQAKRRVERATAEGRAQSVLRTLLRRPRKPYRSKQG
jgi:tetratricopeptide (TPR) repeat protein